MQPEGPYRFTHMLGGSPVGKAWAAIDGQGRFATVAVLDAAVAADVKWRQSFVSVANALAQSSDGPAFTYADFSAASPWVAYPAEAGPGAARLFQALGVEYQAVDVAPQPVSGVPQPVSGVPQPVSGVPQPVSGVPQPVSGGPPAPWAIHGNPIPGQAGDSTTQPVSAAPASPAGETASAHTVQMPVVQPGVQSELPTHDPFAAPVRRIKPSPPPKRRTGLWAALSALAMVVVVGGGVGIWAVTSGDPADPVPTPPVTSTAFPGEAKALPGLKPWAEAALRSPEERALAVAGPSMVFLEAVFTGYLRNKADNALLREGPVTVSRRCSGFVINHGGYVLSNGVCLQPPPEILLGGALNTVANVLVSEGRLAAKDLDAFVRDRLKTSAFTGKGAADQPELKLYGQLNVAKGDVTAAPAVSGAVVRTLPVEAGNLTLVKLAQENLPTAELNPSAVVAADTSVMLLGYDTTDTTYRSAEYRVETKTVTVSGVDDRSALTVYRVNEDLGPYSKGGIAIDPSGRVIGMVDSDLLRTDKANRILVPVSTMVGLLGAAGIGNDLGPADKVYRSGLEAYFAGDESTAAARFDEAAKSSPANLLAQSYREAAMASGRNGGTSDRPAWAVPLLAGAGGALAVGLVVLVVLVLGRRRGSY
ncbi:trypsin-like peptidase domain-containing protein [Micromonospora noduli]|uniref:Trypsin-like peptidase domain-containing protein n=1 Tax=Micromonospora noduli TaxID=709876 RepID=A0ABX9D260_9ACTN|nr:trypsin-like peptidase domain-containing protein [Micromonospora noduli]RAO17960.1 hypothetical protein MED15_03303 [Micromonospora noduli]RAO18554.1 hypothetical protein LUPAC07_02248 [Micromonospora noduli]RAO43176.1 hypothetical protein ONO86_03752 [Micromonospora noduli]